MKIKVFFLISILLLLGISSCKSHPEYCTVQGTVKGIDDGTKLELEDAWNNYKIIETSIIRDGKFEFHPRLKAPTHVYMYTKDGAQLKDFILEPGTVLVDVDFNDEEDWASGATGTFSNDTRRQIQELTRSGDEEAAKALRNEILDAEQTGALALYFAEDGCKSSQQALDVLSRLSPELSGKPFVNKLLERLTRRVKTEPKTEGSDSIPLYIDMAYPDIDGNPVSLSSVVKNPDNSYVLLDFWHTNCVYCVDGIPELKEIYAKYHEKGFEIYSVSSDTDKETWKTFLADNDIPWVNVLNIHARQEKIGNAWYDYAINGTPTLLLIEGQTGEILERDNYLELDMILSSLLF